MYRRLLAIALLAALALPAAAGAAPYREVSKPTSRKPYGTIVLAHGGSWWATGPAAVASTRPAAKRFARWGWRAVNTDYGQGAAGLADLLAVVDREIARSRRRPVCVYGESSGGTWALMVAALRPKIACVVAVAAPTDLADVASDTDLGEIVGRMFTPAEREANSPVRHAGAIRADTLLAYARNDDVVPLQQGWRMREQLANAELLVMQPGYQSWAHSPISALTQGGLLERQKAQLARVR